MKTTIWTHRDGRSWYMIKGLDHWAVIPVGDKWQVMKNSIPIYAPLSLEEAFEIAEDLMPL